MNWLPQALRHDPQRTFLQTPDGARYSYRDIHELSGRIASALASRGVAASDRVAAQIDKSPQAVALYLACLRLGAVFVPLNTAYTLVELEYFLADSQPRLVVVAPAALQEVRALASRIAVPHVGTHVETHVETLGRDGDGTLMQLAMSHSDADFAPFAGDASALAALLYTSGTTGRSKGAMLTRGNLASNAATLAAAWQFSSSDVLLHVLPVFHVHGLFVAINTVLASGSSMIFAAQFAVDEVLRLLPQATVMMGVPTFYTRLLQQPGLTRESTSNVRLFISGSAPLLAATHEEFLARTGHCILERYGMSETLMNTSNPYAGERVAGSVGPPLDGVEIRICSPDAGTALAPDEVGMIEVRGPNVFSGYWRMPEKTAAEFRPDGFFITGDLGRFDRRGYLYIVGRGKDLIITGGYNVYPIEVEAEIDALPGVMESAVIGVPHPDFGEGVTAIVVARQAADIDAASVRQALAQRLANFKLPKQVIFVAALPRNAMGKVQKAVLREQYRDLYENPVRKLTVDG